LKRLLFILLMVVGFSSASFANFYVDLMGAMINTDDLENQTGLGIGLGYGLNDEIDLYFRTTYTEATDNPNLFNEINYEHVAFMAGIAYTPIIPALNRFRISWKNTFLVGYTMSDVDINQTNDHLSDSGLALAFWTGLKYDATQMISPFFDIGYHKSFYQNKMEDASIQGFQFAFGIRFYLTNTKKYSTGY
jgi:hypothetical protein